MRRSAKEGLLSAILLGAMLAASAPVAADEATDSSITSWVNESLRHDPLVFASEISVSTQQRVMTSVDTDTQNRPMIEGVQRATGTSTRHSDAALAKAIRDSFRRHWTTSRLAERIRVGVEDGVATLTGDLDTWDGRLEAGRVALEIEGVSKVQNRLTVKGYDYEWEKWEFEAPYYYEEAFPNVG